MLRKTAFTLLLLFPLLLSTIRAGAEITQCLIGILFLIHSARQKEWRWLQAPEMRVLAILWGMGMISSLWANASSLNSTSFESSLNALCMVRFIILYAAIRYWLLTEPKSMRLVCFIGLAWVSLLIVDTTWQYLTGISLSGYAPTSVNRLDGPLRHPNIGNFILKISLPIIGIAAYLAISQRITWLRYFIIPFAMLCLSLIMVSGERSITMLMFLALGLMAVLIFFYQPSLRKYLIIGLICAGALIATLVSTQQVIQNRGTFLIHQLSDFWNTEYGMLYLRAFDLWQASPLIGIGVDQFHVICTPELQAEDKCKVHHPHNIYLEWLSETGIIGLCLFIWAMFLIVRQTVRESSFRDQRYIPAIFACATFAVLLWPIIGTQSIFSNWPGMLFWYSLAMATVLPRIGQPSRTA